MCANIQGVMDDMDINLNLWSYWFTRIICSVMDDLEINLNVLSFLLIPIICSLLMDLGSSIRGKVLWKFSCFTLISIVWRERNAKIFKDKWRTLETMKSNSFLFILLGLLFHNVKGIPLNVIQLDWYSMCKPWGYREERRFVMISIRRSCVNTLGGMRVLCCIFSYG